MHSDPERLKLQCPSGIVFELQLTVTNEETIFCLGYGHWAAAVCSEIELTNQPAFRAIALLRCDAYRYFNQGACCIGLSTVECEIGDREADICVTVR